MLPMTNPCIRICGPTLYHLYPCGQVPYRSYSSNPCHLYPRSLIPCHLCLSSSCHLGSLISIVFLLLLTLIFFPPDLGTWIFSRSFCHLSTSIAYRLPSFSQP